MRDIRKLMGVTTAFVVCLLAGVLLFAGCSDLPTNPAAPETGGPEPILSVLGSVVEDLQDVQLVESTLDAAGGVLQTGGDLLNTATFYVPPGALDSSVTITMRVETHLVRAVVNLLNRLLSPSGQVTEFDFGPDGLVFKRACTLTKMTGQPDGRTMTLWYFNPRTNLWERVATAPSRNGQVSFPIWHFSKYAIS